MSKKTLIVKENLELRLPELSFNQELFQIISEQNVYLKKWLSWVHDIQDLENVSNFLKTARLFNQGGQKLITFIFFHQRLIGSVALIRISKENKSAELGYWIVKEMQGKGLIHDSCLRFLKYVFEKKGLHRLEINVDPNNKKSVAVAEKLGFQLEGIMRDSLFLNKKHHNLAKFSLLQSEWKGK